MGNNGRPNFGIVPDKLVIFIIRDSQKLIYPPLFDADFALSCRKYRRFALERSDVCINRIMRVVVFDLKLRFDDTISFCLWCFDPASIYCIRINGQVILKSDEKSYDSIIYIYMYYWNVV